MVDDFRTCLDDIKFLDDTTIFEVVPIGQSSQLQQAADEATVWATRNNMQLNASKTKELFIYFGKQNLSVPPVIIEGQKIERVRATKLLGLTLNDRLTWEDHINSISKKANVRLHYLRHLKRAGVPCAQLITVYKALVRSVTEYACQVWANSITKQQSYLLEQIQRRALKIMLPDLSYDEALSKTGLHLLYERRMSLCMTLFKKVLHPDHVLNHLLPKKNANNYNLRAQNKYCVPKLRTNRCKNSFICWGLINGQ